MRRLRDAAFQGGDAVAQFDDGKLAGKRRNSRILRNRGGQDDIKSLET